MKKAFPVKRIPAIGHFCRFLLGFVCVLEFINCTAGYPQTIRFSSEKLEFLIGDNSVALTGKYSFQNLHDRPVAQPLIYPFVITEDLPFPDSVDVRLENGRPEHFSKGKEFISFIVEIPPKSESTIEVYYRQPVKKNRFEYILTTTRNWQKPLDSADFLIRVPEFYDLAELSFPYERIDTTAGFYIYRLHFEDFYPDKNLIFAWQRRN